MKRLLYQQVRFYKGNLTKGRSLDALKLCPHIESRVKGRIITGKIDSCLKG